MGLLTLASCRKKQYSTSMKHMKLLIILVSFLTGTLSLHAQTGPLAEQIQNKLLRKAKSINAVSQRTNAALYKRLSALFTPPTLPFVPSKPQLPDMVKPITFRVQAGPVIHGTASAFAIERNGHLFGVTAAHVMENIEPHPFMTVQTESGEFEAIPISKWRRGNPFNSDVAVFEIPEQAQPYVQPLPISDAPLAAQQQVSIAGWARNEPLWLPQEEVLFVGAQHAFIRNTAGQSLTGMCGSPIMIDGKVAGLYVGFTKGEQGFLRQGWVKLLNVVSSDPLPPLHQMSIIEQINPLIESLENDTQEAPGTLLRVMGYPVTILGVEDQLVNIRQTRRGVPIKDIYTGPLADPEHLEQFLNITDNDVVSISILHKGGNFQTYSINVSTGEVTLHGPLNQ